MQQRLNEAERAPITTRPPHYPTQHSRETVRHLVAFGLTIDQISYIVRCLPSEVNQHYVDEIESGLARINAQVQAALLHNALHKLDVQAQKLWLINKAGWKAGDANKLGIAVGFNGQAPVDGEFTVTERRTRIETVLKLASSAKRAQATSVIQGEAHEVKSNGAAHPANGHAGPNGALGTARPRSPRQSVLRKPAPDPRAGRSPAEALPGRAVQAPVGDKGAASDRLGNATPDAESKKPNGTNGGSNGSGGGHHR